MEVQVHEPGRPTAVLGHDQFSGSLHAVSRPIHLLPVDRQHHVGVLLERSAASQVVEHGTGIFAIRPVMGQMGDAEDHQLSLEGQRFEVPGCVGQDIGGFQSTPTPELYARWIEEGVFVPVMRAHGTFNSPRWPWAFGDDVLAATKKAIELRTRLIPYFYTFAAQTAASGAPLMRPLVLEFPSDPKTFNLEDEWLMGDRLLAAPVLALGGARDVYLPAGNWYDFNTSLPISGGRTLHLQTTLDTIPSYVRAGTILPLGPVIQSTSLGAEDPLEVRVYPGADAAFTLYEDDGDTYAYQRGASSRIPMRWDDRMRTLTVGARTGAFPGMLSTRHLNIVMPDGSRKSVTYVGRAVPVRF